jgi:alpha-tubulin suppressor-like RCC1 family protein
MKSALDSKLTFLKLLCIFGLAVLPWQAVATQAATTVTNIAAGGYFSLFLESDRSFWGMGDNNDGQLEDGTFNSALRPKKLAPNDVVAIAAGFSHVLFLKSDGSLSGMGENLQGQLGVGRFTSEISPPEEIVSTGVVAIAAGSSHSLFLKSDGSLWAMGYNSNGQLGDGALNDINKPEEIISNGVIAISGEASTLFLSSPMAVYGQWVRTSLANLATERPVI